MSEEMNCFNLSSIVLSAGPVFVSSEDCGRDLDIQKLGGIGRLLLFLRRVRLFEKLQRDRLSRLMPSFDLPFSARRSSCTDCPNGRAICSGKRIRPKVTGKQHFLLFSHISMQPWLFPRYRVLALRKTVTSDGISANFCGEMIDTAGPQRKFVRNVLYRT